MRKHWDKTILALVVVLAAAVRLYHFNDWMLFSMDQARDAFPASDAYENGPSYLPLLGPRAAGTFLRLGPVFYYFQYIFALIFNSNNPEIFSYPDVLFSILSIPLFYYFLRLNFEKFSSLLATSIYAFSFLAIQYSRFSWNPNSIPFWLLVFFIGLLKMQEAKSSREKYLWIATAAVGFGVVTQLHFLAFLSVPIMLLCYFFWSKTYKTAGWRGALLFVLIALIFYSPMILSEFKTSGDNVGQFLWALGNKPAESSLLSNVKNNIFAHGTTYFLFLSSYQSRTVVPSQTVGLILIAGGLLIAFSRFFSEEEQKKKNFLKLLFVWFSVTFLLLVPFALQLKPRFFFVSFFVPFALFAFWTEWLLNSWKEKKFFTSAALLATLLLIALNCEATFVWYKALATNSEPKPWRGRVLELKQTDKLGFTNQQIKEVADYLAQRSSESGKKVFVSSNMAYRVPVQYIFEEMKNPAVNYGIPSRKTADRDALYFSVRMKKYNGNPIQAMERRLRGKFDVIGEKQFGLLVVYELSLRETQPEIKKKEEKPKAEKEAPGKKESAPRRTERVLWGDVF